MNNDVDNINNTIILTDLPIDTFFLITENLEPIDIYNLLLTKKCFRKLLNDEKFVKKFVTRYFGINLTFYNNKYKLLQNLFTRYMDAQNSTDGLFCIECKRDLNHNSWYVVLCNCLSNMCSYHKECLTIQNPYDISEQQPDPSPTFKVCACPNCGEDRNCLSVNAWSF